MEIDKSLARRTVLFVLCTVLVAVVSEHSWAEIVWYSEYVALQYR